MLSLEEIKFHPLKFPFLWHTHVFSCTILPVSRLNYPFFCFTFRVCLVLFFLIILFVLILLLLLLATVIILFSSLLCLPRVLTVIHLCNAYESYSFFS